MSCPSSQAPSITVRGARVMVLPDSQERMSRGGVIIPESTKHKPAKGRVVLVGPAANKDIDPAAHLKIGQRVLFGHYAGTEYEHDTDGVLYLFMQQEDVFAILAPPVG